MRRRTVIVVLVILLAVIVASVAAMSRHASNRWYSTYGASDAAAVNQDNQILVSDVALPPASAVSHLRYDCGIGLRDVTRVLSHPQPSDPDLRRLYRRALTQNATTYRTCERVLAAPMGGSLAVALTSIVSEIHRFDHDAAAVGGRARKLGFGPLLSVFVVAPGS